MSIDHTGIGVADVARSAAFYDATLGALGWRRVAQLPEDGADAVGYGIDQPVFWIDRFHPHSTKNHTAFVAKSRAQVDAFHAAALDAGGTSNGAPGLRDEQGYPPGYYAAFVFDLDGNNMEAVFRGLGELRPERVEFEGRGVALVGERWPSEQARGLAVLLHGGGQTRHSWSGTAAMLAGQGWTTIALDARGHGESGWAADGDYRADALVDDLERVVKALDTPPVLIGASMGGLTALLAEGERGPLARSLVLVDIVPRIEAAGVERILRFMTAHLDGFASLEEVADAVHAYNPHRPRPTRLDGLKKNVRLRDDGRWYWHWDPKLMEPRLDEPTRAVGTERLLTAAGQVRVPTLVVRGGRSDVVSVEGVRELLERLPNGRYVDVESAGHMVAGDENDAFTRSIVEHLASL